MGLVAAFELEDAALAYLAHALAGEIEQVAYLFQSLFGAASAEASGWNMYSTPSPSNTATVNPLLPLIRSILSLRKYSIIIIS